MMVRATPLDSIHQVLVGLQDLLNGVSRGLHQLTSHNQLIQDMISNLQVKDQVQFTDIAKVTIQQFHIPMNHFQPKQFIIIRIDAKDKEQGGILFVHQFKTIGLVSVSVREGSIW